MSKVYSLWIFSTGPVRHIPISSVQPEQSDGCIISGICISNEGILFIVDNGLKVVYRVDIDTGDCSSFGKGAFGKCRPYFYSSICNFNIAVHTVDVSMWSDYLLVLDDEAVHVFTPMGVLIKSCSVKLLFTPRSIDVIEGNVLIAGIMGAVYTYKIQSE